MSKQEIKKYQIYDGEDNRFYKDDPIEEARTGKEAIEKYLARSGRKYNLRRSKNNDVLFKAQPFYEEDGKKYKDGNVVWYAKVFE